MRALLKFAHGIDAISEVLGKIASALVLLTLAVGFYNVLVRYIGRFTGVQLSSNLWIETQWYLFTLVFCLMFPYILKHNVNVRVDFLYARWSVRRQALVDLLGTLIILIPFCILALYIGFPWVLKSWGQLPDGTFGTWEVSPDPHGLPRAPIKSMLVVAFSLLLLQAIAQVIKYVAVLTGHRDVAQELRASPEDQAALAS
jgi:TRAP-type mannitol/chloroaromatic compound transport system permease small subunit